MNPRVPHSLQREQRLGLGDLRAPLLVHLVVNVEYWPFDKPMPRKLMGGPHGDDATPDILNYSWHEYGMRRGLPRLLNLAREFDLPVSASMNSAVIQAYPAAAEAIASAGWEFIGHGVTQKSLPNEPDEQQVIVRALDEIEAFCGSRPRGWLGPGLRETEHTPDILKAAGVEYVFDWVIDDLPCWMTTRHGKLLAMPYSLELNDSVLFAAHPHSSEEYSRRVRDTIAIYEAEIAEEPRVLTLPLHPHLMGVPHRFAQLRRMVELLVHHPQTQFVTGATIADWFMKESP